MFFFFSEDQNKQTNKAIKGKKNLYRKHKQYLQTLK